jgi:hypothetical protein
LHLDAIDGHDSPPQSRTFVHFTPHEWLNQGLLSKRHNQVKFYKAPIPGSPVIIVLDNDDGPKDICSYLVNNKVKQLYPETLAVKDLRKADFVHVIHNLYVVFTPRGADDENTDIEDLFTKETLGEIVSGKKFSRKNDSKTEYGKEVFAKKVVLAKKASIDFSGFQALLVRISNCIEHYEYIKAKK